MVKIVIIVDMLKMVKIINSEKGKNLNINYDNGKYSENNK